MIGLSPQDWFARASAHVQTRDLVGALNALQGGLAAHPGSALLSAATGDVLMMQGRPQDAAPHFSKAHALDPKDIDHPVNHAIALTATERNADALAVLKKVEKKGSRYAHYCSTRANTERAAGNGAMAARWYDRALKIEPDRPKALTGRANVALERGESSAAKRFDKALSIDPGNPMIQLGKAQALEMEGDLSGALVILDDLTQNFPQMVDALRLKAQLRLAQGDEDFASHYAGAAEQMPADPSIPASWCLALAGMDRDADAANVAANARVSFPDEPGFALFEAVYAGASGDNSRAESIFSDLVLNTPERRIYEARHRIRQGEYDQAEALLEQALTEAPHNIDAWSLRGFTWRLIDDPRTEWLHEQAGLTELLPLNARSGLIDKAIATLRRLHEASTMHLGQALRGGTQTRGALFQRADPVLAELHETARKTLQRYRANLPPVDHTHPLLRRRDAPWRITGSWSVRMTGNGGHIKPHIHPEGLISSALYLSLPEEVHAGGQQGWLELGRPPADLGLDLPPLQVIEPREGHIALFPSTLYHNTSPYQAAERLIVAFDVASDPR